MGLLEWSPLVIVDSAMERVKLDIKVDVLLGDFDGDFDPNYKEKQYPLEIVHTQIKTKQILRKLLTICMKEKYLL
jgi:thiamine pyrophosphokinase